MNYFTLLINIIFLLFLSLHPFSQKAQDEVQVTGDVADAIFCSHEADHWNYQIKIKLRAKNISDHPVIISSYDGLVSYYKVADSLEILEKKEFNHIGWITSGPNGDPKSIPTIPQKPFKVIKPNESIEISSDFREIFFHEPTPGKYFLRVVVKNWPDYSREYISKIREAWSSSGSLWQHALDSEPISFVLPTNPKVAACS